MDKQTGYELSRKWFDFCFENPEKIKPNHTAMYFFAIEHCNRLGWKQKFGFPATMVMEAVGIKSYNTYINTLRDLVDFGFIKMIEKSKNQYSSNIIALSNFNKANNKALDKALIKHLTKQSESIDSINKQRTINKEQLTKNIPKIGFNIFWNSYNYKVGKKSKVEQKWNGLSDNERSLIIEYIPKYIKSTPDKKYRKHPITFLNNEGWNDEIINSGTNGSPVRKKQITDINEDAYSDPDRLKW